MNQTPDIIAALISLRPEASFSIPDVEDLSSIEWDENTDPPTEEEIREELDRLTAEYEAQEYARLRKTAYPPIGDQLDALFHAGAFPEEMAAQIQAVKDEFPKPE